jgi:hypothetical protein
MPAPQPKKFNPHFRTYTRKKDKIYVKPCKFRRVYNAKTIFDNVKQFADFAEYLRESAETYLKTYTKNERLVLFLKFQLGWGRRKIRARSGLSEYFFTATIRKSVGVLASGRQKKAPH